MSKHQRKAKVSKWYPWRWGIITPITLSNPPTIPSTLTREASQFWFPSSNSRRISKHIQPSNLMPGHRPWPAVFCRIRWWTRVESGGSIWGKADSKSKSNNWWNLSTRLRRRLTFSWVFLSKRRSSTYIKKRKRSKLNRTTSTIFRNCTATRSRKQGFCD